MFHFQLFGMDATFNEKDNTLAYAGEKQSFSSQQNNVSIRTIYFKFNDICNLRCNYCFQRNNTLPNPQKLSLADYESLLNKVINSGAFDRFILFGGEPLISVDYDNIRKLLTKCTEKKICAF